MIRVYSLRSQVAELHDEQELLGARPEFGAQTREAPTITTSNVGTVIGAMLAEIEKLFDDPQKAADALTLLMDLAQCPSSSSSSLGKAELPAQVHPRLGEGGAKSTRDLANVEHVLPVTPSAS
jgi:hypothetical protein